ncbi:MAG: ABC transporter permease [Verrucomicrobiae bacterium]|nr:ABC transporter permease [Verrucomicrobiae bacterium]
MSRPKSSPAASRLRRASRRHEWLLLGILAAEVLVFSLAGRNFLTADNIANLVRHSTEIGLLALVMLPVILTGGIDLSVGSLLGLCAVVFGSIWRDWGWPWPLAAGGALVVGALGGGFNASLISGLRLPPLIVTLATYSLFRGLAEALTRGTDAFTRFPESFLFLGSGRVGGIPVQAWILGGAAMLLWLSVHRMTWGRSWRAIGFSPEGALHAGLPVSRRVVTTYVVAGLAAGVAALTYAARLGTAKADAGTGYELAAITAVVLGGASIFGGTGTVAGTLLGVAIIAVLTNGLGRLPATLSIAGELSGLCTGLVLLAALAGSAFSDWWAGRSSRCRGATPGDGTAPTPT